MFQPINVGTQKSPDKPYTHHDAEPSGGRGDCGGRGDAGRPIFEWRFPLSTPVTETFRPFEAATCDILGNFVAVGVSGGVINVEGPGVNACLIGVDSDVEASTAKSPSVVSVPLSSCTDNSSPSDKASSEGAENKPLGVRQSSRKQ